MAEKTYNTGRVVGWSSYEEFIRETGVDPTVVSNYVYQTMVAYGVTRRVQLAADGWVPTEGGKFYRQTIQVPGASWGAVPQAGLDYESYMDVFTNPSQSTEESESNDETDKHALESAVGNIFTVYVSDSNGNKVTNALMSHGYLTFVAYPDVLNFQENVQDIDGSVLKLIIRGLSMEDLDVDELYFGPQGFMFAGNGLAESCYHRTENINNLMLQASSFITLSITGNASSSGGGYQMYDDTAVALEGAVSGYLDVERLNQEGYLMDYAKVGSFLIAAGMQNVTVTTDAYDAIDVADRPNYYYLVYGASTYTQFPSRANPLYILCVRQEDGYTSLGVLLNTGTRALLGYDAQNESNPPTRPLNLMYSMGEDEEKVLILKDKHMPDYIGAYWSKSNGWDGLVSYCQQNGWLELTWQELKDTYGAVFHEAGRDSYITCSPTSSAAPIITGKTVRVIGDVEVGEYAAAIHGVYVCTESRDSDPDTNIITLNRRGGYLNTTSPVSSAPRIGSDYSRLPQWSLTVEIPPSGEHYLVDDTTSDYPSRIYRNELVWVVQPSSGSAEGITGEWMVVNIETSGNADLIVYRGSALPLSDASSGVDEYIGSFIDARYTNAVEVTNLPSLLPTSISVYASPFTDAATESVTLTRGGDNDTLTCGTILALKHTVQDVFGEGCSYWYQYLGVDSSRSVLASSVSQKGGTNFYTLAKMVSHLNQGFPRSKQDIPDQSGSYYYDYSRVLSWLTVEDLFRDFGLDIADYLHPDFRGTSYKKFLQNLLVYKHLGKSASAGNKRSIGYSATYNFFTVDAMDNMLIHEPTEQLPTNATLRLSASTDPTSFSSPGFFSATYINPDGATFNLANPDYPIWSTIAKSRNGEQVMSVSMIDSDGSRLNGSGSSGTLEPDTISPNDLLVAFALGKSLDILKGIKVRVVDSDTLYLQLPNGMRVYFSPTEPAGTASNPIPEGSIGIGW